MHFCNEAAHVAVLDEHSDRHYPSSKLATDIHGALTDRDRGQLVKRDPLSIRCIDENVFDVLHLALFFSQPNRHRELLVAFPQFCCLFTAKRDLDDILNIGDIQSVARAFGSIHFDLQLRHTAITVNVSAAHASYAGYRLQHFLSLLLEYVSIRSKHLDHDLTDAFENIVANRLRKRRLHARQRVELRAELMDELFSRQLCRPFGRRLQIDKEFSHVNWFGVGPIFGTAGLGCDTFHNFGAMENVANARGEPLGFVDGNARREINVDPHGAFVQLRQKLAAQPRQRDETCG